MDEERLGCARPRDITHGSYHWVPAEEGWEMQHRPWIVRLQHVRREGNTVADMLSKTAIRGDFDVHYFDAPTATLMALMHADNSGGPVR
ncbi:hypothetical protein V6N11_072885 [Hibiscus sabdariffa]|uniref:RNase H type-1 domain-containing protein n=1 Tax=Hibiscus sabdariffa TaxID=183260 RepID=A0ABR2P0F7_9ROSI